MILSTDVLFLLFILPSFRVGPSGPGHEGRAWGAGFEPPGGVEPLTIENGVRFSVAAPTETANLLTCSQLIAFRGCVGMQEVTKGQKELMCHLMCAGGEAACLSFPFERGD